MMNRLWLGTKALAHNREGLDDEYSENRRSGTRQRLDEAGGWGPATCWRGEGEREMSLSFVVLIDTGVAWQDSKVDVYWIISIKNSRFESAPKRMIFVKTSHDGWLESQLNCALFSKTSVFGICKRQKSELDKDRPIKKLDYIKEVEF